MHGQAQDLGGLDDLAGHVDIRAGGCGITRGVIVGEDESAGRQLKRPADNLPRIDRGVVHRAFVHGLVGDQLVPPVEEKDPELLARFMGHGGAQIGGELGPGGDHGAAGDGLAADAHGGLVGELEVQRRLLAQTAHPDQVLQRRAEHAGEGAEAGQQGLGQRLDVPPGQGPEEQELEKLVVRQGARPAMAGAMAQAGPMAGVRR